jgi:hypothetical protein
MTTKGQDERIGSWLGQRLPADWFVAPPEVVVDREEITVVGRLAPPAMPEEATDAERAAAEVGQIRAFRERSREARVAIALELEHAAGRKVAWGARCGATSQLFTTMSVPVMTRLRQPERRVLDTLVDAGVARSRSEALAWCVRLVGQHSDDWLRELREALQRVERVRAKGPGSSPAS